MAMSSSFVPSVLKAEHSFLSTLCISSSYVDLMRSLNKQGDGFGDTSHTAEIREGVIIRIGREMRDPVRAKNDHTIMAVLMLLNGELIDGERFASLIHENGLAQMIKSRGGLDKLDNGTQLAPVLTMSVHLSPLPFSFFLATVYMLSVHLDHIVIFDATLVQEQANH